MGMMSHNVPSRALMFLSPSRCLIPTLLSPSRDSISRDFSLFFPSRQLIL